MKPMVCNECESPLMRRTDDEEQSIYERLRIYHQHEQDLLAFFTRWKNQYMRLRLINH